MRSALPPLAVLLLALPAAGQSHIAKSDPLSPADERKTFTLPPGFEAQLVAAEPDIGKPIQMAFDARGRLWVTTSRHYPFAAEPGQASDKLYVLSDFGPDGKAGKVTVFAADLNIPIGVLPLPDGNSCLASSVGEIVKLTDTDGDGKADKRETILTGFGTKDTHGMYNSFVLLPDGWVYACHGFSNDSKVTAKDGSTVTMHSGNTFRFRPDGSRVEPWTFGQVNPFGMTTDPWLNLYTADCHSKPVTQLIRGAYYQSFGKPHDGLGYAPHATEHSHGSTALCGLAWYAADHFPKEFSGCVFLGNVVTNRVNADRIDWRGSSPVAKELPDFLSSSDPWFRPTDVKLGPDGALYVADFYNRIIGHYEVDLKHPLRDKDRGRVWRIVYKGADGKAPPPKTPFADLTTTPADELEKLRTHPNLTVRLLAMQQQWRRDPKPTDYATLRAEAVKLAPADKADAWGKRVEVEKLTGHPDAKAVPRLVEIIQTCPPEDTHLRHAARVALRNCLGVAMQERTTWNWWRELPDGPAKAVAPAIVADAALGLADGSGVAPVGFYLTDVAPYSDRAADCAYYLARHKNSEYLNRWLTFPPRSDDRQAAVLTAVARGTLAAGQKLSAAVYARAERLVAADRAPELAGLLAAVRPAEPIDELFPKRADTAKSTDALAFDRRSALNACLRIDPARAYPVAAAIVAEPAAPPDLWTDAVIGLAGSSNPAHAAAVVAALRTAPAATVAAAAPKLASHKPGADALLTAVSLGKLSPRLLQERAVLDKLRAARVPDLDAKVKELTKGLPPVEAKTAELIRGRADGFRKAEPDAKLGAVVFAKHCAACHQLNGQGAKVGPQLDGIGNRGLDRLAEDVLDPNRNVDAEFRTRVLNLVDGRVVSGAFVKVDGAVWVLADQQGKEVRVPQADVESWTHSAASPMPSNWDTAVPEADFYHLLAYLLEQRVKPAGK